MAAATAGAAAGANTVTITGVQFETLRNDVIDMNNPDHLQFISGAIAAHSATPNQARIDELMEARETLLGRDIVAEQRSLLDGAATAHVALDKDMSNTQMTFDYSFGVGNQITKSARYSRDEFIERFGDAPSLFSRADSLEVGAMRDAMEKAYATLREQPEFAERAAEISKMRSDAENLAPTLAEQMGAIASEVSELRDATLESSITFAVPENVDLDVAKGLVEGVGGTIAAVDTPEENTADGSLADWQNSPGYGTGDLLMRPQGA